MNIEVFNKDGQLVTTSLNIAEVTGKDHKHVIRDIERLIEIGSARPKFGPSEYFIQATYLDANSQHRKMYYLTKKGTAWLINRYTGDAAVDFQLAYIEKFEEMENKINEANKLITSVKSTCILTKHDESISILRSQLDAGSLLGVPLHLVQIEAVKEVRNKTGIDYSTFLKLAPAQNNIPDDEVMLESTELGKLLNITDIKMNKLLASVGLQAKINDQWIATDKAEGYYTRHSWTSGNKSGYNYKWNKAKVMDILDKVVSNYNNIEDCIKELCN